MASERTAEEQEIVDLRNLAEYKQQRIAANRRVSAARDELDSSVLDVKWLSANIAILEHNLSPAWQLVEEWKNLQVDEPVYLVILRDQSLGEESVSHEGRVTNLDKGWSKGVLAEPFYLQLVDSAEKPIKVKSGVKVFVWRKK